MKVLPFEISKSENTALTYQEDRGRRLYDRLHLHKETQWSYVVEGEGSLIVGDTVNDYKKGDILIIGGDLPHIFKSDTSSVENTFMISLFFTRSSFGDSFFDLGDMEAVIPFLKRSLGGCKILSDKAKIGALFLKLKAASKFQRLIIFFQILDLMTSATTAPLSTFILKKKFSDDEGKRMSDVMNHTMRAFHTKISLYSIAAVANMTPNAFCRYFKQRTNKTYFQFLIEIRVEHACRLLSNSDFTVYEISEKAGFGNISNFNKAFKKLKGTTPSQYRASLKHLQ